MKRLLATVSLCAMLISGIAPANADQRLELSLALTPTFASDERYEAFSEDDLSLFRVGADVRFLVANIGGFKFIPFLSYRYARDGGEPFYIIDTDLDTHDFAAGLRVSKNLLSFLGVFAEASGGVLLADMSGSLLDRYVGNYYDYDGSPQDYNDRQWTWMAQGLAGLEFSIPEKWLKSRGVNKFGFGVELAFGYTGRGKVDFEPKLEEASEYQIETRTTPWGKVSLSGWTTQVAATFKFF
jgi:hypothetical protein